MKKIFQGLALLLMSVSANSQNPVLTYTNVTGSNSITCNTPSVNFAASVSNYSANPLSFLWSNGSAALTGSNVMLGSSGQYTLVAYNVASNFSLTQTFSIGTNTTAPVSALSPTFQNITCLSPVQTVTAVATPSINITHNFYSPAGMLASAASYTAVYNPGGPGTYTHCLINNINGCSTCRSFSVASTDAFPTLTVSSVQNFTTGCSNLTITTVDLNGVTTPPGGALSFTVLPPGYPTSAPYSLGAVTHYSLTVPGTWLAIVGTNNTGVFCETKVPFSVTQNTAGPTINYIAATNTLTCITPSIDLQAWSTNTNVMTSWIVPVPPTQITSPFYTASEPGTYTLNIVDNGTHCVSSTTFVIIDGRIYPALSPSVPAPFSCPNPTVLIYPSILGPGAVNSYYWLSPANANVSGANSFSLTTDSPGPYKVIITNIASGCAASTDLLVSTCTGIYANTIANNNVVLFPNPNNGLLTVTISDPKNTSVEIYNTLGALVKKQAVASEETVIDLKNESNGIYLIYVLNNNKTVSVSRIVKQ